MYLFTWLAIIFTLPATASAERILRMGAAAESFPFNQQAGKNSGCVVSLPQSVPVKILSETANEFEVEWKVALQGCLWQQLKGQSLQRGFVRKEDVIWDENPKEELPNITFEKRYPKNSIQVVECLDATARTQIPDAMQTMGVGDLVDKLRREAAGLKGPADVEKYIRCYPKSKENLANYYKYKKFLEFSGEVFRIKDRREPQEVDPQFLTCLFRRESAFESRVKSNTGAQGLGQHTDINISEISRRLKKEGSWESALWKKFFARAKADPMGQAMWESCKGSAKGDEPVFNSKADAACPLQSIAASSIYILMIQRELARMSKVSDIQWESELDYLTAIAATYNLGEGAAGRAVKDLLVEKWVPAIQSHSKLAGAGKSAEVAGHVDAIRNCLRAKDPWQPMHPGDVPVCPELGSVMRSRAPKIKLPAKPPATPASTPKKK